MTEYTYGPWQVHTPGKCPVPPDALVQAQRRDMSQVFAESRPLVSASDWNWGEISNATIAYYRIARKAEWSVESGWLTNGQSVLDDEGHPNDQFRVYWPVIDGQPDFTRQPKWEKI